MVGYSYIGMVQLGAFVQELGVLLGTTHFFTRPWGFRPDDISAEVYLWHGEVDATVPVRMGRYMANVMPNCRARFLLDEGHISLIINHANQILSDLVT